MQLRGTQIVVDSVASKKPVISGSGATRTLNENESGSLVLFDRAAGIVFTLPTPKAGINYDFAVKTEVTSNSAKVITETPASEFIAGTATMYNTLAGLTSGSMFLANGTSHVAVTMNGGTTGGKVGTRFSLVCDGTAWQVSGMIVGSTILATPFTTS